MSKPNEKSVKELSLTEFKEIVLADYRLACESREASLLGRKEVLTGKAKFGIFGDGKELAQIALAKQFREGDYRSGYYRDQTIMLAIGELTYQQIFAQLYSHTSIQAEPHSAGRQMNSHFTTRYINEDGTWKDMTKLKITTTDLSPTAAQIPRTVGLGLASKLFRKNKELHQYNTLSNLGNEVVFTTIGDASTSEGIFFEAFNAMGVLQVPVVLSVWDDGYGISVPTMMQTTKESISRALAGFQRDEKYKGWEIMTVNGWDYPALCLTYKKAAELAREQHVPVLVHVTELTQPQGHSTSGSHERYKSEERLAWEKDFDCNKQFKEWIIKQAFATEEELKKIEEEAVIKIKEGKEAAWKAYITPIKNEVRNLSRLFDKLAANSANKDQILQTKHKLLNGLDTNWKDLTMATKKVLRYVSREESEEKKILQDWLLQENIANFDRYNSLLYSHDAYSATNVKEVKPIYNDDSPIVDGRIIIRDNFDALLAKEPKLVIFGEDSGKIGGVNQGLEGLQKKYGEVRVSDTGIREATILGKGVGMAIRGLRPIAEIQYLDYLVYGLMTISDDLASLHYRTKGGQKAPLIIRTRGHRFEGIWHSGSPMGMIINSLRGMYICVPRNMTQAAGLYNTLLSAFDPALVIEPLLAYRRKEKLPANLGEFKIPLGVPEILVEGKDVTIVTYGSCVSIVLEATEQLKEFDIHCEIIDIQTLLPFDTHKIILESLKKTNRLVVMDEDVSGGATGYMLQQILEEQGGYFYLDSEPKTISAQDHRPAYGSDGNYFSKPNVETVFDKVYKLMREAYPNKFPGIY
ncbi:MAG: thiamine pyrophosphate-dependent enzyme [Bacteroidetes bacterium]|nr:thiamine pyrophosphate-dependent enzyme [Bacteroidota bacterium]